MRLHQRKINDIASDVIAGTWGKNSITLDCTPGGGKTGAGTLLANRLLDAGVIDSVLWLVPRISLAEQVEDAFANGFGKRPGRRLEVVDGRSNLFAPNLPNAPCVVGHVTTYQQVATKRQHLRFRDAMAARRTLMILDEVQFLRDEPEPGDDEIRNGWSDKVKEAKDAAAFVLLMSGTLWRTDDKRIPFVEYERREGRSFPLCDVSYTLRDAVTERAILPTEWRTRGGTAEYIHKGENQTHELIDDGEDEEARKVRTILSSDDFVCGLLDDMVCDWQEWRQRRGYNSRMIVMAEDTKQARRWRDYLQSRHNIPCVLATTREEAAGRKLRHFRERRSGQCLVTVAMAYVGFDCPDLTHLAYLTPTRAPSWLLQSFARVSRFDSNAPIDYDHQHAFVYAPDDQRLRVFFDWMRAQQEMGVRDRRGGNGTKAAGQEELPLAVPDDFEPISGLLGAQAVESLDRRINPETAAQLDAFTRNCPYAANLPKSQLYEILAKAGFAFKQGGA